MESLKDHIKKYNPNIVSKDEADKSMIKVKLIEEVNQENQIPTQIEQFDIEPIHKESTQSNDSKIINLSDKNHFIRKWFRTRPKYYFNPFVDSPDYIKYLFFLGICLVACLFMLIIILHI